MNISLVLCAVIGGKLSLVISSKLNSKGGVTLVNLQRQLATPIRNASFSHEFADMLHLLQVFESLTKPCNALQHCK